MPWFQRQNGPCRFASAYPFFLCSVIWLNMLQSNPGCVCVSVCVAVRPYVSSLQPKQIPNLIKLSTNDLEDTCECHFSRFLKFRIWGPHSVILHFCVAALSWSQFWSDFLQIWIKGANSSSVFALKISKISRFSGDTENRTQRKFETVSFAFIIWGAVYLLGFFFRVWLNLKT